MDKHEDITSLDFSRTSFWVQLHGPSIQSMSRNIAMEICSAVGKVDDNASGEREKSGYNFLQVWVHVNNSQHLCREQWLSLANGKEGWVWFMYE